MLEAVPRQLADVVARARAPVLSALKSLEGSRQCEIMFIRFAQLAATALVVSGFANCLLRLCGGTAVAAKKQDGDTARRRAKPKRQ